MKRLLLLIIPALCALHASAQYRLEYEASTIINAGSGDFAPSLISAHTDGILTQPVSILEMVGLQRDLLTTSRFEYGFGITAGAGWTKATDYKRFDAATDSWEKNPQRPAGVWLQQLWGGVKYRSLFLEAGMKNYDRSLFDSPLGIGDYTYSDNARPVPQVRVGFIDFQDIPLTNHWVQIRGEIAYGKFFDKNWLENHYNYYNSFLTTGTWMHHKSIYFRTNPQKPFSVTIGMQDAVQFGGTRRVYSHGVETKVTGGHVTFADLFKVFIPRSGGNTEGDKQYVYGNHIGSYDLRARYRLPNGDQITAFFQLPWEDGSGMGKLNGWDGIWGLQYEAAEPRFIDGALVEYIDFTNQSGPMHYAPGDLDGDVPVTGEATGADDYYNNYYYNGWTNYGLAMGTPFIKAPFYNTDGYLRFTDNRVRGFQAGICGTPLQGLKYRVIVSWRESLGTPLLHRFDKVYDTSAMLQLTYTPPKIPHLSFKAQVAFDSGKLLGNNSGALVSVEYSGHLLSK